MRRAPLFILRDGTQGTMPSRRQGKSNGSEIGSDINTLRKGGMLIVTISLEEEGEEEGGAGRVQVVVLVEVGE